MRIGEPAHKQRGDEVWLLDRREVSALLEHLQPRASGTQSRMPLVLGQRVAHVLPATRDQRGHADRSQIGL
jgi:hypothetical protein